MSKRTKSVIGILVTVIIIIVLMIPAGYILDPKYAQDGIDAIRAFYSVEKNSLDVIVYGSSRSWKGCDTRVMYEDYGLNAYNYSANWLCINTVSLFLQDSLKTQKPQIVCIETGLVNYIEKDVELDGQVYYTKYMHPSKAKRNFLKQCFGDNKERYLSYMFPLIMFHDNWSVIGKENFSKSNYKYYIGTRGFCPSTDVRDFTFADYNGFTEEPIREDCMQTLNEMVNVCRENDIQILFFTIPCALEYRHSDAMSEFAAENGCTYLNLYEHIDEMGLDEKTDIMDEEHLNENGAGKVGAYLSQYIINHYELTD